MLVSVIVPAYNAEKYIKRCITSILEQSYREIELIIVDDGSKDNTEKIISEYVKCDNRIIYIKQNNSGVSAARNKGFEISQGEYIMFADSDDWMAVDMIKSLVMEVKQKSADVVFCNYNMVDRDVIKVCDDVIDYKVYDGKKINYITKNMFAGGKYFSAVWRGIYRSELIKRKNIKFVDVKFAEDLLFNIEYLLNCNKAVVIKQSLYNYFRHEDSSLERLKTDIKEVSKLPYNLYEILEKCEVLDEYNTKMETVVVETLYRILDCKLKYKFFKTEIREFYLTYFDMFEKKEWAEKKIKLMLEQKTFRLYVCLWIDKIKRKYYSLVKK